MVGVAMIRPGLPGGAPGAMDERPIFPRLRIGAPCAFVHLGLPGGAAGATNARMFWSLEVGLGSAIDMPFHSCVIDRFCRKRARVKVGYYLTLVRM